MKEVKVRINSKGQVTIPAAIRRRLGWQPHTEVEFEVIAKSVVIRRVGSLRIRGQDFVSHLKGKATSRLSTGEILALTRADPSDAAIS